jgi:head-tail adaptor
MGLGAMQHTGIVANPVLTPDGEGGYVETWTVSGPEWPIQVQPASIRDMERAGLSTITGTAPAVVTGRYRPDVTLKSRIAIGSDLLYVASVQNVDRRNVTLRLIVVESVS